jgi:hypothetical protein
VAHTLSVPLSTPKRFDAFIKSLSNKDWVVYARVLCRSYMQSELVFRVEICAEELICGRA